METAGRTWAAKKIPYFAAVSNCYTIRNDYDLCSEDLEEIIRERRLLRPGEKPDFAKAMTQPALRQWLSVPRQKRMEKQFLNLLGRQLSEEQMQELLQEMMDRKTVSQEAFLRSIVRRGCSVRPGELMELLSDHFDGEINQWRFGPQGGENVSICMHANLPTENQTAASMIMAGLNTFGCGILWAPASPCMSVYIPLWWTSVGKDSPVMPRIPSLLSRGGEFYEEGSLWWAMERLVSLTSVDEARFCPKAEKKLQKVAEQINRKMDAAELRAVRYFCRGDYVKIQECFDACTQKAADLAYQTAVDLSEAISKQLKEDGGLYGPRKELLEAYSRRTNMPL